MNKCIYISIVLFLGSCTTYKYTESKISDPKRLNKIENKVELSATNKFAVDVRVELDQIVTATSSRHTFPSDARNEAYYNCIVNNNIDVIVDPLYKRVKKPFYFIRKYRYEVRGYAGFYENVRDERERMLDDEKNKLAFNKLKLEVDKLDLERDKLTFEREDALFKVRGKNLNALAKIDPAAREVKSSYMIEKDEGCCPDNNSNVVVNANSSGNGFGNVHLLHTAENQSSLVDEYLKLICHDCDDNKNSSVKQTTKSPIILSSNPETSNSQESKSMLQNVFCKVPILKRFLCN
tara:strand:- start:765 stop:1643 length:879 start_codon:yes stop_codon:yes gene_type:complete